MTYWRSKEDLTVVFQTNESGREDAIPITKAEYDATLATRPPTFEVPSRVSESLIVTLNVGDLISGALKTPSAETFYDYLKSEVARLVKKQQDEYDAARRVL